MLQYHELVGLPTNTIVWGFINTTPHTQHLEDGKIGDVIHEFTVNSATKPSVSIYKHKKDGGLYSKASVYYVHEFYRTKQEAEEGRKQAVRKYHNRVLNKIDTLQRAMDRY